MTKLIELAEAVALKAFQAGIERGRDEMQGGILKYDHEITKPPFERWWQQFKQEHQLK